MRFTIFTQVANFTLGSSLLVWASKVYEWTLLGYKYLGLSIYLLSLGDNFFQFSPEKNRYYRGVTVNWQLVQQKSLNAHKLKYDAYTICIDDRE